MNKPPFYGLLLLLLASAWPLAAQAADLVNPDTLAQMLNGNGVSKALPIVLGLTLLALIPGMLIAMTAFTRVIIVLSMLRQALGMQETPPNSVLIILAALLTMLSMSSTLEKINEQALSPLIEQRISSAEGLRAGSALIKEYMIVRTREQDMNFVLELSGQQMPEQVEDISLLKLTPAFLLSELKLAFQIGFVVFLPFLLIDIIVSGILMAMGMMMVPPITISLPIKILIFVLVDGWTLIARAVLADSF
ncbi:flagellar type III secretion system pore protein FliP [Neisseriaceae bacterium TC5R-5]|nr:flagellar type III secretion system pore protein FliP [Neisseriaceae bacterium TC5R-5]